MLSTSSSLAAIRSLVSRDLADTNDFILTQLATNVPFIKELGEHILKSGGKRLRPLLVLLSAKLFQYEGFQHTALAAVIEFIHTATLLHDDVVDGSLLRRGQKTANALWGNEASILVGDFLYSRSFQIIVRTGHLQAMDILASATNRLAEGEVMQLLNVSKIEMSEANYYEIIERKTAMLFSAAAQMGALLCQRSESEQSALASFGKHLGMAFQIIDDLLDYNSGAREMGKNPGDDLAKGKVTLPLLYALRSADAKQRLCIEKSIVAPHQDHFSEVVEIVRLTGALDYTRDCAKAQADKAIAALAEVPDNDYRDGLIDLAHFAVSRDF